MSCNSCQAKFSFFTKENGCPNCGFSYCNKCLKYKYNLPVIGEKKICGKCFYNFQKNSKVQTMSTDFPIPAGLEEPLIPIEITKRLEALENPARPPIVMYKQGSGRLDKLRVGLDPIDQEIVNRLKKLKNEDKQVPPPTEEEIRRRLALLKDLDPNHINQPVNINTVDTRTTQEKTDDLIREYLDRLEISKTSNAIDNDIQARLDTLRGIDSSKYLKDNSIDMEECDEETATKKIIEKALAEAALEAKFEDLEEFETFESKANNDNDDSIYDTCVMCDKTTDLMMCKGCNSDLYCSGCFDDNHDDFEMHRHKTVPYKASKS